MIDLTAIEARAKAATPGPWWTRPDYGCDNACVYWNSDRPDVINGSTESTLIYDEGGHSVADAEFIAHAREDIPALIAEVRRLEGELHVDPENEIKKLRARNKYLEGELEREKLSAQSAGEALDNVVADHKKDVARLADIKAEVERLQDIVIALSVNETHIKYKARPIVEAWKEYEKGVLGGSQVILDNQTALVAIEARIFRALATALEGE